MIWRGRWWYLIYLALFFYLLILQIHAIWPFTIDDMYISLRYAKHWVSGIGLLWNPHSSPVEGYSNFSFVVLAAISLLIHLDPVIVLKAAGCFGLVVTCIFLYQITRLWFNKNESFAPAIWLLLYQGQIIWAVSGLETAIYEALMVGSVYFCFRGLGYASFPAARGAPKNRYFLLAGLLMALAGMTRPEAPVFMFLFGLLIAWDLPKRSSALNLRSLANYCALIMILFVPYFIWRWNYYGKIFPNPVYCKGFDGSWFRLDMSYLKLIWPLGLLSIPACFKATDKRHYFLWFPSIMYLLMLLGADSLVSFQNRLFLPAFALILPLAFHGSRILLNRLVSGSANESSYLLVIALGIALICIPKMTLEDYRYFTIAPTKGEELRKSVAKWLNDHSKTKGKVVLSDAGLIPYASSLSFIDSYCLNNVEMTKDPASTRYEQFCKRIMPQEPNYFVLTSLIQKGEILYSPSDYCLKEALKNNSKYKLNKVFTSKTPESEYRYELFVKF